MAESNLLKILKEAIRDSCASRNNGSSEKTVKLSYSDSSCSCSENNNSDADMKCDSDCPFCESQNQRESESKNLNDQQSNEDDVKSHYYNTSAKFKNQSIEKEFNMNLNYEQNAVKRRGYNNRASNKSQYSEKEFNMQTQEISEKKMDGSRSYSYRSRSNCISEQTEKGTLKKNEFNRHSTYRKKNWQNKELPLAEQVRIARKVLGQAASFKPFVLKESLNDLSGCGVDIFKIGKNYNCPSVEYKRTDNYASDRCCTRFEIDVPLTGMEAKMNRLTSKDIAEEPEVPFGEPAWDDDLLY